MDPAMSEMPAGPLRDIGTFLLGEKKAAKLIRVSRSLLKGSGYPLGDEIEKIAKLKSFTRARRKVTTGIAESVWRKRAQTKEVHSPIGHAGWATR